MEFILQFCTNAAMECKVSDIVWRDFMPDFSFHNRLCSVQQKSWNTDKRFLDLWWLALDSQSCLHQKKRAFECLVFDKLREKVLWKPSIWLCIQTSTWIEKWIVRKVDFEHVLLNEKSLCKAGLWYLSNIVVPKILVATLFCGWNKSFGVNKLKINIPLKNIGKKNNFNYCVFISQKTAAFMC